MKLVLNAVVATLFVSSAQAGWFGKDEPKPEPVMVTAPVVVAHPYAMPVQPVVARPQAPAWFVKMPEDTNEMVFAAGTGASTDEQMAYDKARLAAERKLIERTSSTIRSQTKSYRNDQGDVSIENFEVTARKNAQGELIGSQRVDSQVTFDGRTYKVYVLLRLPLGDANPTAQQQRLQRLQKEAEIRSKDAFKDLDKAKESNDTVPISQVTPVTVPSAGTQVMQLLDVDNVEYKQRRDQALTKPGAVIGHVTVQ